MPEEAPKRRAGRPRGSGRKPGDGASVPGELTAAMIESARQIAESKGEFPPDFINGVANPDYYRAQLDALNLMNRIALKEGRILQNYKQGQDGIIAAAEYAGVDRRILLDARSDVDKVADLMDTMAGEGRSLLEATEEEIAAVERVMDASDAAVQNYLSKRDESEHARWAELGKRWGNLIKRLRVLRMRATTEIPFPATDDEVFPERVNIAQRIAKPLRLMCYVIRSNISSLQKAGGAGAVPIIEDYHGKMAYTVFCARNRCEILRSDMPPEPMNYSGAMVIIPPGHGKTQFAVSVLGPVIAENPNIKILMGHAVEDEAVKTCEYLKTLFKPDNPSGRRMSALYGQFKFHKKDNGTGRMRLLTREQSRQPTIRAYGMKGRISGSDADIIWFDDPVDKQERDQQAERDRTYSTMMGTWMTRLRGPGAWHFTTATLWHHDDANAKRLRLAKEGKIMVKALVIGCGGPEHVPAFKPLSKTLCPASKLRDFFNSDPMMYAAAYRSDPSPEEMRIIRKIRYYDPDSEEHAEFARSSLYHLSLDPSATARAGSDKAGIVYAASGTITGTIMKYGEPFETKTERRVRIIWAAGILATQSDLVEKVTEFSAGRRVDYIHVEVVSGYAGTAEMFRNLLGIQPICHQPGNRSKELRLRGVASMIEDSYRNAGGSGACVEFPGKVTIVDGEPKLGPDPAYEWLYRQFLEFGSINDDHCLDATTQLVAHLQRNGEIEPGQGFVTNQIHNVSTGLAGKTRMQKFYETMREREKPRPVELEDAMFFARMN